MTRPPLQPSWIEHLLGVRRLAAALLASEASSLRKSGGKPPHSKEMLIFLDVNHTKRYISAVSNNVGTIPSG